MLSAQLVPAFAGSIAGSPAVLHAALTLVAADALGCLAMYGVGLCMGTFNTKKQGPDQLSDIQDYWSNSNIKNANRVVLRSNVKVAGAACFAVLAALRPHAYDLSKLPSLPQMILFSCWYSIMGLADELNDLPTGSAPVIYKSLSYIMLAIPIPFLMVWNPTLYTSFAFYQLTAHSVSQKIDTTGFKAVAFMGFICAVAIASASKVSFPITGMACATFSNFLWQIHDESPFIISWTKRFPLLQKMFDMLSFHTVIVCLVLVGLLPPSWLSVQSPAYAVSKLGLARGNLQKLCRSNESNVSIFPKGKTQPNFACTELKI